MYIKPLSAIIDSHSIIHHSFADDLQLQMSAPPDRIPELLHSIQSCISDVKAWATANMLKLNHDCLPILMLLYIMLYIVHAYLMLFDALTNAACLYNASFFAIDFCKCFLFSFFVLVY